MALAGVSSAANSAGLVRASGPRTKSVQFSPGSFRGPSTLQRSAFLAPTVRPSLRAGAGAAAARPARASPARNPVPIQAKFKGTVVPDPDVRLPLVLLGAAGVLVASDNTLAAAPVGLLGALLLFQTTRVRFVFGEDALEVRIGQQLEESGENVFVGGENKWKYDTFVNWEFWWPSFPVLVYFKETQTKPEGQIHFFPIILNGKQLYDVMKERCGPSKNSA